MQDQQRAIVWDHGILAAQRLGGMLGPVTFILGDGRQISPLQVAPWGNDHERSSLPGILQQLRGEWPCVPFGADAERELSRGWAARGQSTAGSGTPHGFCSNEKWSWVDSSPDTLALQVTYPDDHPVKSLLRRIIPDPAAPAIDFELEIETRIDCRLPIGLHPVFRLPSMPGMLRLEPGAYRTIHTYPGTVEPGASIFAENRVFDHLREAPLIAGGTLDASRLPLDRKAEDLLQIAGIDGNFALHNLEEKYRVRLGWRNDHFPSLLLWFSNRGRTAYPWNGNHLALGVEPIASAFDLGTAISTADNPIAASGIETALSFKAGETFRTSYRIEVEGA
ncbi:hypothetical protein JJB09_05970 [Rhizobium sp. KVB221]|uniref:Uncharacterized protein n=1 Tax=Rhizobium setariae TaxID=2801340 RepID=A0A936YNW3_9HYPH|nr:hypothetical protein [Rhizobium setariae]MBL0371569.1 hypothetical protein [Rhizobium setariae]